MLKKLYGILGSIRFYQVLIGAVVIYLGYDGVISMDLAEVIAGLFGVSVVIRTVDRLGS